MVYLNGHESPRRQFVQVLRQKSLGRDGDMNFSRLTDKTNEIHNKHTDPLRYFFDNKLLQVIYWLILCNRYLLYKSIQIQLNTDAYFEE